MKYNSNRKTITIRWKEHEISTFHVHMSQGILR